MDGTKYTVGTQIKLHTDDAWNNLHGIIDDKVGDVLAVFCVAMPLHRYFVYVNDVGRVLELIKQ